jgi:hypothetical protein
MPTRFYFHLVSSDATIPDDMGAEAATLGEAKSQAWQFVTESRQEYGAVIEDWGIWQLEIVCSEGTLLHRMPLANALNCTVSLKSSGELEAMSFRSE